MTTLITNDVEVLKIRIIRGIEYCNSIWQQAKDRVDGTGEYNRLMRSLQARAGRLSVLIELARAQGCTECVFTACRWNDESFICFGCTQELGSGRNVGKGE